MNYPYTCNTPEEILQEMRAEKEATDKAIASGRVLFAMIRKPHQGGFWQWIQELSQTLNALIKIRKPCKIRFLITYDE